MSSKTVYLLSLTPDTWIEGSHDGRDFPCTRTRLPRCTIHNGDRKWRNRGL